MNEFTLRSLDIVSPVRYGIHLCPYDWDKPIVTVLMGFSYTADDGACACRTLGKIHRFDDTISSSDSHRYGRLEDRVISGKTESELHDLSCQAAEEIIARLAKPDGKYYFVLRDAIYKEMSEFLANNNVISDSQVPDAWAKIKQTQDA